MKTLIILILSTTLCLAGDPLLPDHKLTPGEVFTNLDINTLCQPGYTAKVRNVPSKIKKQVFIEYFGSVPAKPGNYEIDHLISLELGGDNSISNLWPQSYLTSPWNSHVKDRLEDWMHLTVKRTLIQYGPTAATQVLHQFQEDISVNWTNAYTKYIGVLK